MEDQQEMTQEEALAQVQAIINPVEETPHDPIPTKIGAGSNAQQTPQATEAQEAQPEAPQDGAQRSPEGTGDGAEGDSGGTLSAADKYQQHLQRLLEQNREARQKQQQTSQQQQEMEFARQLAEARKYGPEAVMKVLGIQQEQRSQQDEDPIDIRELLGLDGGKSDADRTTRELTAKIAKLESYLQEQQQKQEELFRRQQEEYQRQQMTQWEQQEYSNIQKFLDDNAQKYEYVSSLKQLGSDKDVYDGIITMYQQGYQPSYDDMAQLIESRVEALAESLLETPKFRRTLEERLGVKLGGAPQPKTGTRTLSGSMVADSATQVAESPEETEEQNLQRAMRAAMEAKSRAEEALKKRIGA